MASISIKGLKEVKQALKRYGAEVQKAQTRALNRTIDKGRTQANKEIRNEVRLTAGYVREQLNVRKATYTKQIASIVAKKRGILMSRFPHTVRPKRGVTVRIKKGAGGKTMPKAFKVRVKAGGRQVEIIALRVAGRYANKNAKFKALYGPSPSQVFNNTRKTIAPWMEKELKIQLQKELEKASARARR